VFCGSLYEEESLCCGIRGIIWYRPLAGQLSWSYDPSLRAMVAIRFSFHPRDISSPLGLERVYFAQLAIASPNPPSHFSLLSGRNVYFFLALKNWLKHMCTHTG